MPIRQTLSSDIIAKATDESARRQQLAGSFLVRATGLKRLLGSVELDAIVQAPASLYLSVRSFFSQPARVLATDGKHIYLREISPDGSDNLLIHPVNSVDVQDMLPIQITPSDLVNVILGRVVFNREEHLEMTANGIRIQRFNGEVETIVVRRDDGVLINRSVVDHRGALIYSVKYEDFRMIEGVDLAHTWNFEAHIKGNAQHFTLKAEDVNLNGKPYGRETFRIERP